MEAVVDGLRAVDAVDVSLISSYQNPKNSRLSPCVNGACTGKERRKIHVRLLLSIDRRETTASAMETVCRRNMIFFYFGFRNASLWLFIWVSKTGYLTQMIIPL